MNIFKKSLTKYFNWNKNYTKSSNRQVSSSFGMVGTPCLEAKHRLCQMVGQSFGNVSLMYWNEADHEHLKKRASDVSFP